MLIDLYSSLCPKTTLEVSSVPSLGFVSFSELEEHLDILRGPRSVVVHGEGFGGAPSSSGCRASTFLSSLAACLANCALATCHRR